MGAGERVASSKLEFSRGDVLASKYEVGVLLDESPLGVTYRVKHIKWGKKRYTLPPVGD